MSDLTITGWKPGLQTVPMMKLLMANSNMGLRQAKQAVEHLMEGKEIRLSDLSEEQAQILRPQVEALNAVCR
jgi:hypothetical protein